MFRFTWYLFQLEGTKEEKEILGNYLPNYKINLVDAERLEDVEKFSDDLQVILTMLRYRDSKEELTDYINENKKFFQNVDYETSQAMIASSFHFFFNFYSCFLNYEFSNNVLLHFFYDFFNNLHTFL